MGELWLARSSGAAGWEKQVVLKTILPHLSDQPEFVERFLDEAHIATTLSHGNIVPVFELGHENDTYFLVMEYVDGWDLRTLLRRATAKEERVPESIALYIASEVCRGLDYAHTRKDEHDRPRNIVHRDISPANILLSRDGDVRIVDFGIASARSRLNQTLTGELRGKFAYMSPEQAAGETVDARSDLFSLGVVLYEMLAGVRPFEGNSDLEILGRVQRTEYRSLRELRSDLNEATYRLIERALAPKAVDRFAHAAEMHEAILHILYQETGPVSARQLADFCLRFDRPRYSTGSIPKQSFDALLHQQLLDASASPDTPTPSYVTPSAQVNDDSVRATLIPMGNEGALKNTLPPTHEHTQTITLTPRTVRRRRRIIAAIAIVLALIVLVSLLAFRLGSRSASNAPVVRIHTEPDGALIYFNGVSYGRSTLVARPTPGEWLLRAELDGYHPVETNFLYDGKDDLNLHFRLEALPQAASAQTVTIESIPPGRRFRVNNGTWRDHGESVPVPIGQSITIEFQGDDASSEGLRFEHTFRAGESRFVRQVTETNDQSVANTLAATTNEPSQETPTSGRTTTIQRVRVLGLPNNATLYVNDERQANTDTLRLSSNRSVNIRAQAPGYLSQTLRYDPRNSPSELQFSLEKSPEGTLTVRFIGSVLIGEVLVNGQSHGFNERAPRTQLRLPVGEHLVRVQNPELQLVYEETINIREGEDTMLRIEW